MRGRTAFGVCTMLMVTFCGLSASGASAEVLATPHFAECVKASPKNTGNYTDKKCEFVSTPGAGKYSRREGVGAGGGWTAKTAPGGYPTQLKVKGPFAEIEVSCKKAVASGNYALPDSLTNVKLNWSKCKSNVGASPCTSEGASTGEIRLSAAKGEVGYLELRGNERPAIGEDFQGEPTLGHFACGHELEGAISGQLMASSGWGGAKEPAQKSFAFAFNYLYAYAEQELHGQKFIPEIDWPGWAEELTEIKMGERPPRALLVELCGTHIEAVYGESCTPPLYAGLKTLWEAKGEPLALITGS
jgi:hypothetical protein